MDKQKILELLNNGQVEEVKLILRDEIYTDSFKTKPDMKQRYSAMKKFVSYNKGSIAAVFAMPEVITFDGQQYEAFINKFSIVLTTESSGVIEPLEGSEFIPNLERVIKYEGNPKEIDFNSLFAEARSKGYKLNKSTVTSPNEATYFLCYDGAYYNVGILDIAFSIINDGKNAKVFHKTNDAKAPIVIKNDVGICAVLPRYLTRPYTEPLEKPTIIKV